MTQATTPLRPITSEPAQNPIIVPLVIISPVRDESKYLRRTLDSIVAQTRRPIEWILVDDGSSDSTPDIIKEYTEKYPFIRLVHNANRGYRKLGGGVIVAFNFGKTHITHQDYQYIAKLDGDMSFGPLYIEHMLSKLQAMPKLASVSGKVYREERGKFIEERHLEEQVAGQFKLYRREAFEDIGGFIEHLAWDGIDIHEARLKGWQTLSYYDPDAWLWHHRIMGSSDRSLYVGRLRWGRGNWYMGYHPLYAIAAGINRMREKPYFIGGLLMIIGYFNAAIRGLPQYESEHFRRELKKWQLAKLRKAIGLHG
ncbi:glycosyltransferase family 2 protein [Pusillimonas sp. CC-YST705]|uniref:Glycosyltransferase family 2 protein n=1 Tax=Mesopusillimonas faecipullorum TaxID=2755040 RepID=A0ABS8CG71_9BURK|nr:glycosyltransferase family A protein [Mesopusillimonas faecipullorum]MCB5364554.1 glycosyltransferase family 2 protein [Mesopusillimonas faecipullorum]